MKTNPNGRMLNDLLFLINMGFLAIIIILLPFINPAAEKAETDPPPQGNLVVTMTWESGSTADIDLWMRAPSPNGGPLSPVGYSHKAGKILNLLRDDLGKNNDSGELNMEVIYSRGIPSGEYVVNVVFYAAYLHRGSVDVRVEVGFKEKDTSPYKALFRRTVQLPHAGKEVTVVRFTMEDNKLVPGSEHWTPVSLWIGAGSTQ